MNAKSFTFFFLDTFFSFCVGGTECDEMSFDLHRHYLGESQVDVNLLCNQNVTTQQNRTSFAINKVGQTKKSFSVQSVCVRWKKWKINSRIAEILVLSVLWTFPLTPSVRISYLKNIFGFFFSFWYRAAPTKSLSTHRHKMLFFRHGKRTHALLVSFRQQQEQQQQRPPQ